MTHSTNPTVANAIARVVTNAKKELIPEFIVLKTQDRAKAIEFAKKHMKELDAEAKRNGYTGWPKMKAQLGITA